MSIKTHILTGSKDVKQYAAELKSVAKSAVESVKKTLPIKDVDIVFYGDPGVTVDKVGGIWISSSNSHTILIALNPQHLNFENTLRKEFPPLLVRELQYALDIQK